MSILKSVLTSYQGHLLSSRLVTSKAKYCHLWPSPLVFQLSILSMLSAIFKCVLPFMIQRLLPLTCMSTICLILSLFLYVSTKDSLLICVPLVNRSILKDALNAVQCLHTSLVHESAKFFWPGVVFDMFGAHIKWASSMASLMVWKSKFKQVISYLFTTGLTAIKWVMQKSLGLERFVSS